MTINEIVKQRKITKYRLSKLSGVPHSTIIDICNGKTKIEKCSAATIYKLAKTLNVSMESLLEETMEHRSDFEVFKSNVCHLVKDMGDIDFIIDILTTNRIRIMYQKQWYPESLYLLAMVDYLSIENALPLCSDFDDLRLLRIKETLYPAGILALCAVFGSDKPKEDCLNNAIFEFLRFNIVESEVRNVY